MGIFSGLGKKLGTNTLEKLLRARALSAGDYGAAAQITGGLQKAQFEREKLDNESGQRQSIIEALIKQGVPPEQAQVMGANLEAAGKAQAEGWGETIKPRQWGPEGGSLASPDGKGGYQTSYSAPAWQNGSLFGSAQGGAAPQLQIEGEKTVPVEAGGGVVGVKPYSGDARPIVAPNTGQGQFGQPAPAPPPPPTQGGEPFTYEQYRGAINGLGAEGASSWAKRNNIAVRVTSENEMRGLPSGLRVVFPDGSEGVVP